MCCAKYYTCTNACKYFSYRYHLSIVWLSLSYQTFYDKSNWNYQNVNRIESNWINLKYTVTCFKCFIETCGSRTKKNGVFNVKRKISDHIALETVPTENQVIYVYYLLWHEQNYTIIQNKPLKLVSFCQFGCEFVIMRQSNLPNIMFNYKIYYGNQKRKSKWNFNK